MPGSPSNSPCYEYKYYYRPVHKNVNPSLSGNTCLCKADEKSIALWYNEGIVYSQTDK